MKVKSLKVIYDPSCTLCHSIQLKDQIKSNFILYNIECCKLSHGSSLKMGYESINFQTLLIHIFD